MTSHTAPNIQLIKNTPLYTKSNANFDRRRISDFQKQSPFEHRNKPKLGNDIKQIRMYIKDSGENQYHKNIHNRKTNRNTFIENSTYNANNRKSPRVTGSQHLRNRYKEHNHIDNTERDNNYRNNNIKILTVGII